MKFTHPSTAVGLNCVTEKTFMLYKKKKSITRCNQIIVRIQQCFSPFIGFLPAYLHTQGLMSPDVKSLKWSLSPFFCCHVRCLMLMLRRRRCHFLLCPNQPHQTPTRKDSRLLGRNLSVLILHDWIITGPTLLSLTFKSSLRISEMGERGRAHTFFVSL